MKNQIKKFANDHTKEIYALCAGVTIGATIVGVVARKDIKGLDIIDINLIHDVAEDVDFLCVARANGTFQNFLFEFQPRP